MTAQESIPEASNPEMYVIGFESDESRKAVISCAHALRIINKLQVLSDVGLGYVRLGQPSTKLSGGEAQRIKLATAIDDSRSEKTLFVFDEPTTGLHLDDINTLLKCFRALVEKGHSVIIIEHHLNIIAAADFVIDLGPEAGDEGGYVIASGTPEEIMKEKRSHTGKALKTVLI